MPRETAADGLDMSTSALRCKEIGEVATSVHGVRSMVDLYGIYDPNRRDLARGAGTRLVAGLRRGGPRLRRPGDRSLRGAGVPAHVRAGTAADRGLHARIFNADRVRRRKLVAENDVAVRLVRQRRLTDDEHPIHLTALVDETALRRPTGGADVLRKQLYRVLEAVELERAVVRVLPVAAGWHRGMDGAFTLLNFPDREDRDVLFVAHPMGAIHVEKECEVREAALVFEQLLAEALPAQRSGELIEQAAREL